jgi:hypothetical protein
MAKKYFTVVVQCQKYKVFLDDIAIISKRIKKIRPAIPTFNMDTNDDSIDLPTPELVAK